MTRAKAMEAAVKINTMLIESGRTDLYRATVITYGNVTDSCGDSVSGMDSFTGCLRLREISTGYTGTNYKLVLVSNDRHGEAIEIYQRMQWFLYSCGIRCDAGFVVKGKYYSKGQSGGVNCTTLGHYLETEMLVRYGGVDAAVKQYIADQGNDNYLHLVNNWVDNMPMFKAFLEA
jgi:hypothetical protein